MTQPGWSHGKQTEACLPPSQPLMCHTSYTYLWVWVYLWVPLGAQEGKEKEAVTTSQGKFPPICQGQGHVRHDLTGDEGCSREPEALTQYTVCTGQEQERVSG